MKRTGPWKILRRLSDRFWQLFGLSAFACAQPLFDILARHSEFLVVHRATPIDILFLTTALILVLPLLIFLIEWAIGLLHKRLRDVLHVLFMAVLLTLIVLPLLNRLQADSGWLIILQAVLVGTAGALFCHQTVSLRRNLKFLAWSGPLFVAIFLFNPQISKLLTAAPVTVSTANLHSETPVVLIVFDALPTCSLLDHDQMIDRHQFPNLRALADQSVWFRNATSVDNHTTIAIPAILTGKLPQPDELPILADHPENLFTLLQHSHEMWVHESHTQLLPEQLSSRRPTSFTGRIISLSQDLCVVYQHVVLPPVLAESLPQISDAWKNFSERADTDKPAKKKNPDRMELYGKFLNNFVPGDKPGCLFLHSVLPHSSYEFYPGGARYYGKIPSGEGGQWGRWSKNAHPVLQVYQRHLMQVGLVDKMVGQVVAMLQHADVYDQALIIITADHGISFHPNDACRSITKTNFSDIAQVPVIMKLPDQTEGTIDDRFFPATSLLPTIVDVLDLDIDWSFDGQSAFAPGYQEPEEISIHTSKSTVTLGTSEIVADRLESVQWKLESFGDDLSYGTSYQAGEFRGLVGSAIEDHIISGTTPVWMEVKKIARLENVEFTDPHLPGALYGMVFVPVDIKETVHIAISLNGQIAGVTEPYPDASSETLFSWGMVARKEAFVEGYNEIACWLIGGTAEAPILTPISLGKQDFSLLGVNTGGRSISGVKESGLRSSRRKRDYFHRWTNGHGILTIPLQAGEAATSLEIGLTGTGPDGADLKILVNSEILFDDTVPKGRWKRTLSLEGIPIDTAARIEIISSVHYAGKSTRPRGVTVRTVILHGNTQGYDDHEQ